jgi:hypothetical protein
MNDHILKAIDEEIARLSQARDLLGDVSQGTGRKTARKSSPATGTKPRRKLSPKARHAIAEAQRKRWAKVKAEKKLSTAAAEK